MEKIYRGMANGAETINRNFSNGYGQKIGDIHISFDSSNPSARFGGTWERFGQGKVLVGVNENDADLATPNMQGGSTNPLTTHGHAITGTTWRSAGASGSTNTLARSIDTGNPVTGGIANVTAVETGDNTNHKNWQPFVTVYMWRRTA